MTSLAAAVAVDSRGPASLYVITDSRISWSRTSTKWDGGRKTFRSPSSPDVFGFCGDAYFVPLALGQILELAALGVVRLNDLSAVERHSIFFALLKEAIATSPVKEIGDVAVFHGARDGEFMSSRFVLWRMHFDRKTRVWHDEALTLDETQSYFAYVDGSGAAHVRKFVAGLSHSSAAGTSRAAMYAFTQSLRSGSDPFTGGAPQLVGLWRKGAARQFGFSWNGKPHIAGMEVPMTADFGQVDWFNHLFERCDGKSGSKLLGASSHRGSLAPRPKSTGASSRT